MDTKVKFANEEALEVEGEEDLEGSNGWRNLYLRLATGSINRGTFLWVTKDKAENAAAARNSPELTEYLGAFPEIAGKQ